ncbi:hypothetical protein QEN19_001047 [Hanseniaspora menglaensis]
MLSVILRPWKSLTIKQKQTFINKFTGNYRKLYPGSKTNVSFAALKLDMEQFDDAPALFGIFYEDLRNGKMKRSRLSHESFFQLLVEDKRKRKL